MWIWRKLLRIPWTAKRTNESVLHELGEKPNLFYAVIKCKLEYFGHIARRDSDILEKQIMFGKVEGVDLEEDQDSGGQMVLLW